MNTTTCNDQHILCSPRRPTVEDNEIISYSNESKIVTTGIIFCVTLWQEAEFVFAIWLAEL